MKREYGIMFFFMQCTILFLKVRYGCILHEKVTISQ
jgi:hypothetical protein